MYLLGVDIGSSSDKCAVFDELGNLISIAKTDYAIIENGEFVEKEYELIGWIGVHATIESRNAIDENFINDTEVLNDK